MFDLMSPCACCPFKKGYGERYRLTLNRLREIMTATAFTCHKTIDYSVPRPEPGDNSQQCAGLMSVLHRMDRPNQMMQVMSRLGALDLDKIDPRGEAYANFTEVLIAHGHESVGMIAEIIGPSGRVHYRRPPDDPMVAEARRIPGYSVRYVEDRT